MKNSDCLPELLLHLGFHQQLWGALLAAKEMLLLYLSNLNHGFNRFFKSNFFSVWFWQENLIFNKCKLTLVGTIPLPPLSKLEKASWKYQIWFWRLIIWKSNLFQNETWKKHHSTWYSTSTDSGTPSPILATSQGCPKLYLLTALKIQFGKMSTKFHNNSFFCLAWFNHPKMIFLWQFLNFTLSHKIPY